MEMSMPTDDRENAFLRRFIEKRVKVDQITQCWVWQKELSKGYGRVSHLDNWSDLIISTLRHLDDDELQNMLLNLKRRIDAVDAEICRRI